MANGSARGHIFYFLGKCCLLFCARTFPCRSGPRDAFWSTCHHPEFVSHFLQQMHNQKNTTQASSTKQTQQNKHSKFVVDIPLSLFLTSLCKSASVNATLTWGQITLRSSTISSMVLDNDQNVKWQQHGGTVCPRTTV